MSLRGICTICINYFDDEKDISVTPCGHLFHGACLNQWIAVQRICPQCRAKLTARQIINKIFINVPEEDKNTLDPFHLKNKLDESENKVKKHKKKKQELRSALVAKEEINLALLSQIKDMKTDIKNERNTVQLLKSDMDTMKKEVDSARKAKEETKHLRNRLKLLEKVEICLNGQRNDVDNMLSQYTSGTSANDAKQLATFCVAMKQEYDTIKESRSKLSNDVMKLKRELHKKTEFLITKMSAFESLETSNANLLKSEETLIDENKSLKKKLAALQQAIASPSDTRSSAISRLISESPAPQFLTPIIDVTNAQPKRINGQFPIKKPKLSVSFDSDDIDLNDSVQNSTNFENISPTTVKDSPQTSQMKKHCKEMGLSFVKTTSIEKNNKLKLKHASLSSSTFRNKLLAGKQTTKVAAAYDGLGGHKKLFPPRFQTDTSNTIKFSSSNSAKFSTNSTNRFDRLKRLKIQK